MKILKSLKSKSIHIALIVAALTTFTILDGIHGTPSVKAAGGELKVHFIDVGDADCILVQQGDRNMLIDAGNSNDEAAIKDYLHKQGVSRLDILIGTHEDEDHIGSMDAIINELEIDKIYMPKTEAATKYYEDVLKEASKKGLQITEPESGRSFKLGEAVCTILGPVSKGYNKINNYSVVMKLQYGNTSFLFTGDAESVSEKEMMRRGFDLSANVLKLGHHGSIRSTSSEFLERVNPQHGVIMVGNNNYRHPHKRTMEKLKKKGIKVYRTDENGTVIAVSDGESISFNKKPGSYHYRN